MARREVDICDFDCDRIATIKCALCAQDGCRHHLGNSIEINVTVEANSRHGDLVIPLAAVVARDAPVCSECFNFFTSRGGRKALGEREKDQKAFQQHYENAAHAGAEVAVKPVLEHLKAMWAEKALIEIDNYEPNTNGFLTLHPTNFAELLGNANIRNAGQFYTDNVTRNGIVGRLLSLTVISSNSIAEGGAQIVIAKEAMTWKSVVGLTVKTIDDPGVKKTIRAWEVGQIQVVNPDAICSITGV